MASFESIFPTFLQKCADLRELLCAVTFMLFIVGTISLISRGFTGKTAAFHLVGIFALTGLLVFLPQWGNAIQSLLQSSILNGLGVDPSNVQDQYNKLLAVKRDTGTEHSWWDILGNLSSFTVEHFISAILWLVGQFASLLLFWAYIIQKFILFSGYALSPILIGFMAIRPLRSVGGRYLMHLVGVLLWPLGWAVAALITQGILDFMTDPSFKFLDPTASFYSLTNHVRRGGARVLDCVQHDCGSARHPEGARPRRTGRRPTHLRCVQQLSSKPPPPPPEPPLSRPRQVCQW